VRGSTAEKRLRTLKTCCCGPRYACRAGRFHALLLLCLLRRATTLSACRGTKPLATAHALRHHITAHALTTTYLHFTALRKNNASWQHLSTPCYTLFSLAANISCYMPSSVYITSGIAHLFAGCSLRQNLPQERKKERKEERPLCSEASISMLVW